MVKLFRKILLICVALCGLTSLWFFMIWSPVSQTYVFWQHGIEKYAYVLAFDHTSTLVKGGIVFHYVLNIDGHRVVKGFLHQLQVGHNVPVITLSDNPSEEEVVLASKSDGVLNMFSSVIGGRFLMAMFAMMVPVMAVCTYMLPTLLNKIWLAE